MEGRVKWWWERDRVVCASAHILQKLLCTDTCSSVKSDFHLTNLLINLLHKLKKKWQENKTTQPISSLCDGPLWNSHSTYTFEKWLSLNTQSCTEVSSHKYPNTTPATLASVDSRGWQSPPVCVCTFAQSESWSQGSWCRSPEVGEGEEGQGKGEVWNVCVFVYVRMCIVRTYAGACWCQGVYVHVCLSTRVWVCICVCMCVCTRLCMSIIQGNANYGNKQYKGISADNYATDHIRCILSH